MKSNARHSWEIIQKFILDNEEIFAECLEDEHEIEGSEVETILNMVDEEVV